MESAGTPAGPTFYEVHFYVSVTGADSTHSLGGIAFGINGVTRTPTYRPDPLGPGHPATPTQGLVPAPGGINTDDYSGADSSPFPLSGSLFGFSGIDDALLHVGVGGYTAEGFVVSPDAQANFTGVGGDLNQFDLEDMAFSLNAGKATSIQRTIGQDAPFDLGYVRVYWNQSQAFFGANTFLKINNIGDAIDPRIQYTIDTFASANPAAAGTLSNAQLVSDTSFADLSQLVPEPASLTLFACGLPSSFAETLTSPAAEFSAPPHPPLSHGRMPPFYQGRHRTRLDLFLWKDSSMLALSRGEGQSIIIDGRIEVKIVKWSRSSVRLAIQAPREVTVDRDEIWRKMHPGEPSPLEKAEHDRRERFAAGPGGPPPGPQTPPPPAPKAPEDDQNAPRNTAKYPQNTPLITPNPESLQFL